jgi:hypothetical protein
MIQIREEQIWDCASAGTTIFDVMALLIGSRHLALLAALLVTCPLLG